MSWLIQLIRDCVPKPQEHSYQAGREAWAINPRAGGLAAAMARLWEVADMAAMIAFAYEEIAAVLGAAIIARLRSLGVSSWAVDPLALGSYSHAEPGRANARSVLSTPIQNRIFIAGEACSIHDFSTAHGAYKSGLAAAEACLALNKSTAR